MPKYLKVLLLAAGAALLLSAIGAGWSWWQDRRPARHAEQVIAEHAARVQVDRDRQRAPDSVAAVLAGQRAENARTSTSLQRQDDSLTRLLRPVVLPALPPREQ